MSNKIKTKIEKVRLDELLVRQGVAESREAAKRLAMAGLVRINTQVVDKPGHKYPVDTQLEIEALPRFVSRGGEKLAGAFAAFPWLQVAGKVCLDVGASTGGFTDCLLQNGARRVIALDVGHGQLHWKLRQDERVQVMENFNARYLQPNDLEEQPEIAVVDVAFISLKLILPPLKDVLPPLGEIITLIKPQFEAGPDKVPHGVVRDPAVHQEVIDTIRQFGCDTLGLEWLGCVESPLRGPEGNREFLASWRIPAMSCNIKCTFYPKKR